MTPDERNIKVNALLDLLEYSLIIPEENKVVIAENADTLTDDFINNLGKILAYEHTHRDELNEKIALDFAKYVRDLNIEDLKKVAQQTEKSGENNNIQTTQ